MSIFFFPEVVSPSDRVILVLLGETLVLTCLLPDGGLIA